MDWSASLAGSSDATIAVMGISALIEGEEGAAISSAANGDRNTISLPKNPGLEIEANPQNAQDLESGQIPPTHGKSPQRMANPKTQGKSENARSVQIRITHSK